MREREREREIYLCCPKIHIKCLKTSAELKKKKVKLNNKKLLVNYVCINLKNKNTHRKHKLNFRLFFKMIVP